MEEQIRRSKAIDSISRITDSETKRQAILTATSFSDKMDQNEIDFSNFSKIEENTLMDLNEFKEMTGGLFSGKRDGIKNIDAALEGYLSVRDSNNLEEKLDKFKTLYEATKAYNGKRNKKMLKFLAQLSMEKYKLKNEIFNVYTNEVEDLCDSNALNHSKLDNIRIKLEEFNNHYFSYNNVFPNIEKDFKVYISNTYTVRDKIHSIMNAVLKYSYGNTEIVKYKDYINFFSSYKLVYKDLKAIIDRKIPLENILNLSSKDIDDITNKIKNIFNSGEKDLKNYILNNISIKKDIHNIIKEKLDTVDREDKFIKYKNIIKFFNKFGFSYDDLEKITYKETILNNILEINSKNLDGAKVDNMKADLNNVNHNLLAGILETGVKIRYTDGSAADELGDTFGNQTVRGHYKYAVLDKIGGTEVPGADQTRTTNLDGSYREQNTWHDEKTPGVFAPKDTLITSLSDNTSKVFSGPSSKLGIKASKATNGLVLAQIGQDEDSATKLHGSYNMQLHELGHGIDYTFLQSSKFDEINDLFKRNLSKFKSFTSKIPIFWQNRKITDSELFKHIQKKELNNLFWDKLSTSYYYSNIEEYFAESFSMYNSKRVLSRNQAYAKLALDSTTNSYSDPVKNLEADNFANKLPKEILKSKAPMTYSFFELLSQL